MNKSNACKSSLEWPEKPVLADTRTGAREVHLAISKRLSLNRQVQAIRSLRQDRKGSTSYQFGEFFAGVEDAGAGTVALAGPVAIAEFGVGVTGAIAGASGVVALGAAAGAETGNTPNRSRWPASVSACWP